MIWKGHISFGLVSIPVALHPAERHEELDFTLLDKKGMTPIGYRKVNKSTGRDVPGDRVTRGFEYAKGKYVVVSDTDLKRASPERTQRIDILSFTDQADVDPRYFERPYYLAPVDKNDKGYVLLRDALHKSGKVGIASVVLRARQHLAAVIPLDSILVLDLLRYASELRDPKDLSLPATAIKGRVSPKELRMAEQLVEDMVEPWDPDKYHDEYKDELLAFIRKRVKTGKVEEPEAPAPPRKKKGEVIDIMHLLKQSLDKGNKGAATSRRSERAPAKRRSA